MDCIIKALKLTQEEIAENEMEHAQLELEYWQSIDYEEAVNNEIRKKYSVSEEFAILRQKDNKQEEYLEYYNYCEECKLYAKKMISENSKTENEDIKTIDNTEQ